MRCSRGGGVGGILWRECNVPAGWRDGDILSESVDAAVK
jgi:hypothetical protein